MNGTRTAFAVLAMLLCGLALAQTKPYTNKVQGFAFEYPTNWQPLADALLRRLGLTVAFRAEPGPSGFATNLNVVVQTTPQVMTLQEYVAENIKQLQNVITDYTQINRNDASSLGGRKATELMYRGVQGKFNLEFVQYITLDRTRFVVLTFTAEQQGAETYRSGYEQVRSSFKFL